METGKKPPLSVYLSYAQKDEALKQEFEDHLLIMELAGLISLVGERQVQRGIDWSQDIDPRLLTADLVLLLVSPGLLASGYCAGAEIREVFKRSEERQTRVIPIMLHYVNVIDSPLAAMQSMPGGGRPLSSWPDRNEAWKAIDQEIRNLIRHMR